MTSYVKLFDAGKMMAAVRELAGRIAGHFASSDREIALVGIHQLGVPLARLLHEELEKMGRKAEFGMLDITMYRDDIGTRSLLPMIHETVIPFDVNDKEIILVDDVLSTGRTIRAALDALTDYGRPGLIRLAVLVDRGEPEFPIRADFVGFEVSLPAERKVLVNFESSENMEAGIYDVKW
ncbi:MAG: bifunctional pyr operon transcriptional regulator/uracil phosphoribosyltransferase PyrR [Lentisphaerae bacterium]|nr:bifunctional pyr operon transcriptional regulator/uracil phosphoribosyltransferase PyrR [Lentisphaerota bacterium]MBQ4329965.1 bifunctional pyr operon transcriptional regulator/uracil phosphoribosyltransferase PyrR [Lentisphaeria bacterium]